MATRTFQRRPAAGSGDPQKRIADLVARQGSLLMRIARQWSLCADDAQDAYQRALEIYVRRVDTLDPATETAWLKVVVKHEALAVRRARQESVTPDEVDFDAHVPAGQRSTEERFESSERVSRSAEIMRRLKPDEATALMLKAEGLSYQEIGARQGWTYTNVVATLALFIALGGTSYAALTLPRNSVGAEQIRKGAVRASELRPRAVTGRSIRDRSVGLRDISPFARESLRGRPGERGPAGPQGPSGITYRTAVDSGGGTPRGNSDGASHLAGNEYTVFFPRNVDDCVATATLAAVQNGPIFEDPPGGQITVAHLNGRIRVRTFNQSGAPAELPFNLIVAC